MAGPEYQIGALWMEGKLSFLEQLCLKSFVDAGHHVVLYHYGPLENVPDGIELADAEAILPRDANLAHARTGSPALHSDLFRYKMLEKSDRMIWADTDAYCVKPFETPNGHFYGWESKKHINGGVLGLPKDCDTLAALLEFTSDEFAIPTYYGIEYQKELEYRKSIDDPIHASEQPWGVWGPHAVTHFLHETGEAKYALPQEGLYPFLYRDRRKMLKPNLDVAPYVTENTFSVHLYGRRMRARLVEREGGAPHPKSYLGGLLKRHGIVPEDAPLPPSKAQLGILVEKNRVKVPKSKPAKSDKVKAMTAEDRYGRGQINLTDLADKFGSDKGTQRHRFTELYQMLFLPMRSRKLNLLEIGLQNGGPEQEGPVDRKTDDMPSVRMWLEYFPKVHVYGMDVCDFSWFDDEAFTFIQADMQTRDNIAKAAKSLPKLDIIVDDASHAAHHQQNALVELWPHLKSGGIYVIENLRRQPEHLEIDGYTTTPNLLNRYVKSGVFEHTDPGIAEDLNHIRADISGCFVFPVRYDRSGKDHLAVLHKR